MIFAITFRPCGSPPGRGMVAAGLAMSAPRSASEVDLTLVLGTAHDKTWKLRHHPNDPNSGGLDDLLFDVKTTGSILLGSATAVNQGTKLPALAATPLLFTGQRLELQVKAGFSSSCRTTTSPARAPAPPPTCAGRRAGRATTRTPTPPSPTTPRHFFGTPGTPGGQVGDSFVTTAPTGPTRPSSARALHRTSGTIAITGDAKNFASSTRSSLHRLLGDSNVAAHGVTPCRPEHHVAPSRARPGRHGHRLAGHPRPSPQGPNCFRPGHVSPRRPKLPVVRSSANEVAGSHSKKPGDRGFWTRPTAVAGRMTNQRNCAGERNVPRPKAN